MLLEFHELQNEKQIVEGQGLAQANHSGDYCNGPGDVGQDVRTARENEG